MNSERRGLGSFDTLNNFHSFRAFPLGNARGMSSFHRYSRCGLRVHAKEIYCSTVLLKLPALAPPFVRPAGRATTPSVSGDASSAEQLLSGLWPGCIQRLTALPRQCIFGRSRLFTTLQRGYGVGMLC